ncbi:hypothetical protein HELRODRAFT_79786, partial [Helobdella robusta]|uniref:Uncharacterized protein n=1 Tax=Helobdella robusta TaxID=6412 RepID=T1G3T3_HELRO
QRGRSFATRHTRRLVFKDGSCNVTSANVTQRKKKYLVDIFTTCVDMRWRYLLALFAGTFLVSWFCFALCWYVIAIVHGDHLLPRHANDEQKNDCEPCVSNVYDFVSALLFSIETQHTIGYGYRVVEPTCPQAIILLMVQSCLGVFVQSLMTGLIFVKLSQPKKRAHTIMFSRKAVITKRDGVYCLLFRVGDMRRSHFVGTSIRALLVKDRVTREGECIPLCQFPLDVKTETSAGDAFVFMVWPVVVVHKIDPSSPLWELSASQLLQEKFEIIVIMEGVVESTGMTAQVRTSYLPSEILWGHCLAPLLTYQKENGQYKIDYAQFHAILPVQDMPECSAKVYLNLKEKLPVGQVFVVNFECACMCCVCVCVRVCVCACVCVYVLIVY